MIVFAGPSLATDTGTDLSRFDVRGPAKQGDVYLASCEHPDAIGIIDGYFEGAPAVWHKEILWAMTQGISVFGAASMGALRAAELHPLGMIGVGDIFTAYQDGVIEDDDEVALLHGPKELGYPALSLAMVNCRATLNAAKRAGIIPEAHAKALEQRAKAQFYKTRTWDSVMQDAEDAIEHARLREWIAKHGVDQKQHDALAMLAMMKRGAFDVPSTPYHFEQTDLWVQAVQYWSVAAQTTENTPESGYRLFGDNTLFGD